MVARVRIELRNRAGELVDSRETRNAVMRQGAELIARLFTGQGAGVTHLGVGTNDEQPPDTFDLAALTVGEELAGATEAALGEEAFTVTVDEAARAVRVRVRGTLPPEAAVGPVREAGLLSRDGDAAAVLYNRITFSPIDKGDDHELTLFWEVTFPYGDLAWL